MKKLILSLVFVAFAFTMNAQSNVGFAEKIKLNNIATWYFCSVC